MDKKNNPSYTFGYMFGRVLFSTIVVCACALIMGSTAWLLRAMLF